MKVKMKRKIKNSKTVSFNGRYITFIPGKIYDIDNEALTSYLLSIGDFEEHIKKVKSTITYKTKSKRTRSKKKIPEPVLEKRPESEEEEKPWDISNQ